MKKYVSEKNTVSVYQFMEMCGLECKVKDNVKISHNIMLRKLSLRHQSFRNVEVPRRAPFSSITKENVLRGNIIIVKDDYENCFPYFRPNVHYNTFTQEEMEEIRNKILEERELEQEDNYLKPGYIKYMYKKAQKQIEEEETFIKEQKELIEENYHHKMLSKSRLNRYCRRGFGRR